MKTKFHNLHLENLKRKILSYTSVDNALLQEQLQFYERLDLEKNDTLVSPGQLVHHFYYVAAGCIYYYKLDDGEQKVLEFYTEDIFFTDLPAYVKGTPSNYFLKASEATVVYAIKKTDAENSFGIVVRTKSGLYGCWKSVLICFNGYLNIWLLPI